MLSVVKNSCREEWKTDVEGANQPQLKRCQTFPLYTVRLSLSKSGYRAADAQIRKKKNAGKSGRRLAE
jgi:hypothetical protein